jgi:hypothetical protein
MPFLSITQKETDSNSRLMHSVLINKADVSAIYVEVDSVVIDIMQHIGGTLVLALTSGKEFRFKY